MTRTDYAYLSGLKQAGRIDRISKTAGFADMRQDSAGENSIPGKKHPVARFIHAERFGAQKTDVPYAPGKSENNCLFRCQICLIVTKAMFYQSRYPRVVSRKERRNCFRYFPA